MKIQIQTDKEDPNISLTDERLDNDNFIDLCVEQDPGLNVEVTLPIDELLSAIHAFEQKRVMRITRENKYRE